VMVALGLISNADLYTVLINALWTGGSALLAAVLCTGIQPALELMFKLVTPAKLIELSNPNHPLIRAMLLEAPGTYHHSIIVGNLSEAAASAIGADALLTRVGSSFHDVGKLKRPLYFKENQIGDNPHDRTAPQTSSAIVTAHTGDGALMAQKYRLPEPIVDIIRQHHGDTPVLFFYDKAIKQSPDGQVDIGLYRYDGPKPRSKEAAIVMLADTVEAAARAMVDPDYEKMERLISGLITGKIQDHQLDECALTFADADKITKSFLASLTGAFHERIEYPAIDIPPRPVMMEMAPLPDEDEATETDADEPHEHEPTATDEDEVTETAVDEPNADMPLPAKDEVTL